MKLRRFFLASFLLGAAALITLWAIIPHPGSAIDWTEHPAVVLQSDDWGFCAWMPDSTALADLGPRIDRWIGRYPAFKSSTLESAADMDSLVAVLLSVRGGDGRPALMQSTYVLSSPDFEAIVDNGYTKYVERPLADDLPGWERPGLLAAIDRARGAGVWVPEYHGLAHGNASALMDLLREGDPETVEMFGRRILVNDEMGDDNEYDSGLPLEMRRAELERGVALFEQLFGRRPASVSAPNYYWDESTENLWAELGFSVVQNWRLETVSDEGVRPLERRWRRIARPMGHYDSGKDLIYLYRNAFFEPGERLDTEPEFIADGSLHAITHAWKRGRPAVVCTHRMNYARLSRAEADHGLAAMRALLNAIVRADPRVVFLSDLEVRQLYLDGISQSRVTPDEIRIRNYTHGTRELTVSIPEGMNFAGLVGEGKVRIEGAVVVLTVPPGDCSVRLDLGQENTAANDPGAGGNP